MERKAKVLISVLAAVAALILLLLLREHAATAVLRKEISNLRSELTASSNRADAAAKSACTDRAQAVFKALGYSEDGVGDTYRNHYNPTLKRCVMVLVSTRLGGGHESIMQSVFDADERTSFGEYSWISSDKQKYWEQVPIQCSMKPPNRPEVACRSTAEWETYVKSLME